VATRYRLTHFHMRLWFVTALLAFIVSATGTSPVPPEGESNQATTAPATPPERKTASEKRRETKARREARKAEGKAKSTTTRPAKAVEPAEAKPGATEAPASPTATQPTTSAAAEKTDTPEVEVYIPSVATLRGAADRSKTAAIYRAISGMLPAPTDETGEGLDVSAVFKLAEQIAKWPDTSVVLTVYSMDREGRPRWALRVDWPIDELRKRVAELLESDAAHELLKEVKLIEGDEGQWRLELPHHVLAVLSRSGEGSLIASTAELKPPAAVFGQEGFGKSAEGAASAKKKSKKPMLVYSRLNMEAGEDDGSSPFVMISGVRDVCYGISLDKDGVWNEKLVVRWNPLMGTALKMAFRKTDKPFECPRHSYVVAAFNLGMGEGMADEIGDLPPGTIRSRASSEMAFAAVPGTGFFPFPDLYFQFNAPKKDKIIESIREAIEEDAKKRRENEERPAWREEKVDDQVIFWRDPAADGGASIMPARYRTVLFFDAPEEEARSRLIIAQTSTAAADAVRHWKELTKGKKSCITVPDSTKTHWQARINWRSVYTLAQPYLCVLSSLEEDTSLPPTPSELAEALTDSVINIRIDFGGLEIRHAGPIPVGAAFVPAIVAMALSDSGGAWSEAGREKTACQHLRTLYYHARLFKKDYGRWPATVAELDGYVDFAAHPELLWLWPQNQSLSQRFASAFTAKKQKAVEKEDGEIDDSLYQIDWTPTDWKLKFRDGEFKDFATIYIDMEGEIHRQPKPATSQPAATGGESPEKGKGKDQGTGR
jgi:hypothetical protein